MYGGPVCLWPPTHEYVVIDVNEHFSAMISDACDPAPRLKIISATSSQSDDGAGDGDTTDGVVVFSDHVCLRAERQGVDQDGRTYTVSLAAIDATGNAVDTTVEIAVGHDQRPSRRCIDTDVASVDDGDPRCQQHPVVTGPDTAESIDDQAEREEPEEREEPQEQAAPPPSPAGCSAMPADTSLGLVLGFLGLAPLLRRRRARPVALVAALLVGCTGQPGDPDTSGEDDSVPPNGAVVINVEQDRTTPRFRAGVRIGEALNLILADHEISCADVNPPSAGPSRLAQVTVTLDHDAHKVGEYAISGNGTTPARAAVTIYEATEGGPFPYEATSINFTQGEVSVDAIDEAVVSGWLRAQDADREISVEGVFEVPLCPVD